MATLPPSRIFPRARAASLALALLMGGAVPTAAFAAEAYDNCTGFIDSLPATVSTAGTWCLRKDLATGQGTGFAIDVQANNVVIDCNDFKVGGLAAGVATTTVGIAATNRRNVTVRNCTIRGFQYGVALLGQDGSGHVIEGNRLQGNTSVGVVVEGDGSIVRDNSISDTGGSTALLGQASAIRSWGSAQLRDNAITGVAPLADGDGNAEANGIVAIDSQSEDLPADSSNGGNPGVHGNRIRQLLPIGTGVATGIRVEGGQYGVAVTGNDVVGEGSGIGVSCDNATSVARDNRVLGFGLGIDTCLDAQNSVESTADR